MQAASMPEGRFYEIVTMPARWIFREGHDCEYAFSAGDFPYQGLCLECPSDCRSSRTPMLSHGETRGSACTTSGLTNPVMGPAGLDIPGGTEAGRVVILEDFVDLGDTYRNILTWRGHSTWAIEHTPNGIALAKTLRPRVAIVNLGGSTCHGITTCRELLSAPGLEDCIVILLTTQPTEDYTRAAREAGARDCLKRPMSPHELIAIVEDAIRA